MAGIALRTPTTHHLKRQIAIAGALLAATFFTLVFALIHPSPAGAVEGDTSLNAPEGGSGNAVATPGVPAPYSTPTNDVSVNWSWTPAPSDTDVSYEYALVPDGQAPSTWTRTALTSVSTTVPGEGTYRLYLRTVTEDDQYSDTVSSVVVIDTTAPAATITPPASSIAGTSVTIQGTLADFSDMTLTVGSRIFTLTSGTYDPQTGRWAITINTSNFAPGVYPVTVFARDNAGNATTVTSELRITAPAVPAVTSPTATPPVATPQANAAVPASINPGAYQAVLNDATAAPEAATQAAGGTQVAATASPVGSTVAQTINSDANQGRFIGLAWYWWLIILSTIAVVVGWGMSKRGVRPIRSTVV